jgi:heme o synthase
MKLVRRLSTAAAAGIVATVALGGVVRATDSGDACPDWPTCFGRWVPPLELRPLIEYSHRFIAVVAGVLVVVAAWMAWRRARADRAVMWPLLAAVPAVVVQAAIGRQRIIEGPGSGGITTVHFITGMALVALVMWSATAVRMSRRGGEADDPAFRAILRGALLVTAALLLVGAYIRGEGVGLAFLDWPLMDGRLIPDLDTQATAVSFAHRALALVAVVLGGVLVVRARRLPHPALRGLAWASFVLLLIQAGLGGAAVLTRLSTASVAGHVTGSALAWAALVALATAERRLRPRPEGDGEPRRVARVAGAYVQLMKPDIIVLLLVTTVPAMVLAAGGWPPPELIGATLLGGMLAAGGANALNHYFDRDIDEVMHRTRGRPIPAHLVAPEQALRFGTSLALIAFTWLWATVNLAAAALALSAVAFYVLVYTLRLKRSTPQNIVIGGAAGAVPVLVGWAAVTGSLALPAWVLFAIVFFWTPPHFWALSLKYAGDYQAAGVPMLVVLRGSRHTAFHILGYSLQTFAVSLLLFPAAQMGPLYLGAAVVLGGALVLSAVRVVRDTSERTAMQLFHFSITYLGLLFAAVMVDQLLRGAG